MADKRILHLKTYDVHFENCWEADSKVRRSAILEKKISDDVNIANISKKLQWIVRNAYKHSHYVSRNVRNFPFPMICKLYFGALRIFRKQVLDLHDQLGILLHNVNLIFNVKSKIKTKRRVSSKGIEEVTTQSMSYSLQSFVESPFAELLNESEQILQWAKTVKISIEKTFSQNIGNRSQLNHSISRFEIHESNHGILKDEMIAHLSDDFGFASTEDLQLLLNSTNDVNTIDNIITKHEKLVKSEASQCSENQNETANKIGCRTVGVKKSCTKKAAPKRKANPVWSTSKDHDSIGDVPEDIYCQQHYFESVQGSKKRRKHNNKKIIFDQKTTLNWKIPPLNDLIVTQKKNRIKIVPLNKSTKHIPLTFKSFIPNYTVETSKPDPLSLADEFELIVRDITGNTNTDRICKEIYPEWDRAYDLSAKLNQRNNSRRPRHCESFNEMGSTHFLLENVIEEPLQNSVEVSKPESPKSILKQNCNNLGTRKDANPLKRPLEDFGNDFNKDKECNKENIPPKKFKSDLDLKRRNSQSKPSEKKLKFEDTLHMKNVSDRPLKNTNGAAEKPTTDWSPFDVMIQLLNIWSNSSSDKKIDAQAFILDSGNRNVGAKIMLSLLVLHKHNYIVMTNKPDSCQIGKILKGPMAGKLLKRHISKENHLHKI